MPKRISQSRRTRGQAEADRLSDELAAKLGRMLKDGRMQLRLTQKQAAQRAGIAPSTWSLLEVGRDGRVTLATWNRAAMAVGSSLHAYLARASAASRPRDAVHLRIQELVLRTAAPGGWAGLAEAALDRNLQASRSADLLLQRGTEYALVEIWDWLEDVGAALRDWTRRLDVADHLAVARMRGSDAPVPRSSGVWVVRATARNRRLLGDHRNVFRSHFSGSGRAWLAAPTVPSSPMPSHPAILWVAVNGERIYPARLG